MNEPVISGVYFLFLGRSLTYVGRSIDCLRRVASHRTSGRKFDYALIANAPEHDVPWIEKALISATTPPENRSLKRKEQEETKTQETKKQETKSRFDEVFLRIANAAPVQRERHAMDRIRAPQVLELAKEHGISTTTTKQAIENGEIKNAVIREFTREDGVNVKIRVFLFGDVKKWCESQRALEISNLGLGQ